MVTIPPITCVFTVKIYIYINALRNLIGVWMSMIVCVVLNFLFVDEEKKTLFERESLRETDFFSQYL